MDPLMVAMAKRMRKRIRIEKNLDVFGDEKKKIKILENKLNKAISDLVRVDGGQTICTSNGSSRDGYEFFAIARIGEEQLRTLRHQNSSAFIDVMIGVVNDLKEKIAKSISGAIMEY